MASSPREQNIAIVLGAFFLILIGVLQAKHDSVSKPFTTKLESVRRNLLPSEVLPYVDFGFTNMLADYYWIRTIQDFVLWDSKDPYFINYIRNITALDPKFEYPYLFAILAIPRNKNVETLDKVAAIAEEGMRNNPLNWKIPFYLGTQYHLFTKTYEPALTYIEAAAKIEGVPSGVYLTYSSFLTKQIAGDRASEELIKTIYNTTDSDTLKKLLEKGIEDIALTKMITQSIAAYRAKFSTYPASISDLEKAGLIKIPKEVSEEYYITINKANGSFKLEER